MMPHGKKDPILLSHAELPGNDGDGPCSSVEGRRSTSEEEGHLPGLTRDDLAKSMSGSSVSSYHSALCSEGTETFKDCLEFLDEEQTPLRDAGQRDDCAKGAVSERWALAGAPGIALPPSPLTGPRQAQLSTAAKNSPAPGQGGRVGPLSGDQQPVAASTNRDPAVPRQPGGMLGGVPSDSDEADGEVRALTARAFRSLSGLPSTHLDMCSSHTSSSLSNSLSEDGGRPRRWPVPSGKPRGMVAALHSRVGWPFPIGVDGELVGLLGKEQFECVDVELESGEARKSHCKKRTVPKRQILLKRKERKEMGFGPRGDISAPQVLTPTRKEPPSQGRAIGEDFSFNYQQFMKTASLDSNTDRTRAASCLVKNVLAKKMQYEQMIKMEQKGLRGSSTSSGPSSTGTDLLGDTLEGKSGSLSRSDYSFSAEDLRGNGMPTVAMVALGNCATSHPTKGVVLSEATRENVCKLKKTFNELNERMKYQEVLEGHQQPGTAKEPESERSRYRRARAMFEARSGVGKALDIAPRFERVPKPWPSLRQRAIPTGYSQSTPFKAESQVLSATPPRCLFTSQAQEMTMVPQSQQDRKPPEKLHQPPSSVTPARRSPPPTPSKPKEQGKGCIPQPRDVRKLVKSSYNLCFGTASTCRGTATLASGREAPPATPLVIHCTSIRRPEPVTEPGDEEAPATASQDPASPCAQGPAKQTDSQPSPTQSSPVQITRVQATRREVAAVEELLTPQLRRERSELKVPPRGPAAEGVPHMETHLHVLVGRQSPSKQGSPAQSGAVLRMEKTVLLPPNATKGKEGHGHGGTGGPHAAEGPESVAQQRGGGTAHTPLVNAAPEPPTQEQPDSKLVSAGSNGSAGGTGSATPFRGGEGGEGPSGQLPEQREAWEHLPKVPAAPDAFLPAALAESSGYLAIPGKASKSSAVPKLPSVSSSASASFGTPSIPNLSSVSFGTPSIPNPASMSFGTPSVTNPASMSFGTPLVPNPASVSFGTPTVPNVTSSSFGTTMVCNPANALFGTPTVPNTASMSFGNPLVPNSATISFGTPAIPNSASMSFGTPTVPSMTNLAFGCPSASSLASTSFGSPLVSNPSNASVVTPWVTNTSFGSHLVPNPSGISFGTPFIPSPTSSSFRSPLTTNPVPASLGHPPVSSVANSSFGFPLVPKPAHALLGTGACPLPCGEAPWSKLVPEPPLLHPSEGPGAVERPAPLPPAQPQPHLEDAPHFLRRTEGTSPSGIGMPSPTKPFAPLPPAHRRMLVDPSSGKCYYMEPPRQPQLKTLYDPETGQYLEVLIPPVASPTSLCQPPFNPLVMASGIHGPPYMPYSGFPGLPASSPPSAPSPVHPDMPAPENPSFSGTFSSAPKGEGLPTAGGPDGGYLESPYYIPTGMRASPGPGQPPACASPTRH